MRSLVPRLSVGFLRTMRRLGLAPGSAAQRSVMATVRAIAGDAALPGHADFETAFSPGRANVRRVSGHNLWVLYRFDESHVDILTVRDEPPVPVDA